ncbi:hypothetical protein DPMN_059580 [Dreissena polymorpha]|uniref:Uncharacterized protein n=1 Tax=Dreissena polymorpha TaxID=45954 RepID=A0A9D4C4G0_DREPO|nr:hypothetical protein DPMN_059580 [Dreissena polymorpha]
MPPFDVKDSVRLMTHPTKKSSFSFVPKLSNSPLPTTGLSLLIQELKWLFLQLLLPVGGFPDGKFPFDSEHGDAV